MTDPGEGRRARFMPFAVLTAYGIGFMEYIRKTIQ